MLNRWWPLVFVVVAASGALAGLSVLIADSSFNEFVKRFLLNFVVLTLAVPVIMLSVMRSQKGQQKYDEERRQRWAGNPENALRHDRRQKRLACWTAIMLTSGLLFIFVELADGIFAPFVQAVICVAVACFMVLMVVYCERYVIPSIKPPEQ